MTFPGTSLDASSHTSVDLTTDVVTLTRALVDIPSESGEEAHLADAVETALAALPHLTVERVGNSVVARTDLGHPERVLIAGHLDTVPAAGNLPARLDGDLLHGLGACDMKGGLAVALRLAATVPAPAARDLTYVFYECEEVEGDRNGLGRIATERPELLKADFAILMEPSDAGVKWLPGRPDGGHHRARRARPHRAGMAGRERRAPRRGRPPAARSTTRPSGS